MPACAGQLLPLVLAVSDDPSPAVQRYGHAALASLGWCGVADPSAAAALQPFAPLLRDAMRRLVVGCESSCWGTAMMAATALALVCGSPPLNRLSSACEAPSLQPLCCPHHPAL